MSYVINLIDFFQRGGAVLSFIFLICLFLWYCLLQRYFYIKFYFKNEEKIIIESMKSQDYDIKFTPYVKEYFLAKIKLKLKEKLSIIRTLIVISPLIGLLGTVTGMIELFGVLSYSGSSDIKLMANGISMATIPTMAGMVVSLSGILFEKKIQSLVKDKIHFLFIETTRIFQ